LVGEPDPSAVFAVSDAQASELVAAVFDLIGDHPDPEQIDHHELLIRAEVAIRRASPELVAALVGFRVSGSCDGIMLLRGLPLDDPLPPTPLAGALPGSWRELTLSTAIQLMVMSVIGDVLCYADEKDGRLVQDICPVPGAENRQENTGSCLLELHTEDGFHPNKPHFVSLLGLRSDHARRALTLAAGIRTVLPRLDARHVRVLWEPEFRIRLASSFVGSGPAAYSAPLPVLTGLPGDPDLCVDFHATEPLSAAAAAALEALRQEMLGALVGAVLEPGDLLVVDNRKAVHGRTGFSPRYDGEDRWLRRCFAVADIRAAHLVHPASRVHRALSATGAGTGTGTGGPGR
jgi:L-asparagine oxygenase